MGLISLPTMLRAGYDPRLATGVICASGTLGQLIPPSIVLIFIGDILMGVNQRGPDRTRQFRADRSRSATCSPARSCRAWSWSALSPVWMAWPCATRASCPALVMDDAQRPRSAGASSRAVPPLLLIVGVLGSILAGIATPTESASLGAIGALLLAAFARAFSFVLLAVCATPR